MLATRPCQAWSREATSRQSRRTAPLPEARANRRRRVVSLTGAGGGSDSKAGAAAICLAVGAVSDPVSRQ